MDMLVLILIVLSRCYDLAANPFLSAGEGDERGEKQRAYSHLDETFYAAE